MVHRRTRRPPLLILSYHRAIHPRGEWRACILYLPVPSALPRQEAWTHGKTPRTSRSWTVFAPASLPARPSAARHGTPRLMLATTSRTASRHRTCRSVSDYSDPKSSKVAIARGSGWAGGPWSCTARARFKLLASAEPHLNCRWFPLQQARALEMPTAK